MRLVALTGYGSARDRDDALATFRLRAAWNSRWLLSAELGLDYNASNSHGESLLRETAVASVGPSLARGLLPRSTTDQAMITGATADHPGFFQQADLGTLLLDEISEMDVRLQSKLLRAIQERQIDRVGGRGPVSVDLRIVATTNRDLIAEVEARRFREDLYYRLNVFPIEIAPLRRLASASASSCRPRAARRSSQARHRRRGQEARERLWKI